MILLLSPHVRVKLQRWLKIEQVALKMCGKIQKFKNSLNTWHFINNGQRAIKTIFNEQKHTTHFVNYLKLLELIIAWRQTNLYSICFCNRSFNWNIYYPYWVFLSLWKFSIMCIQQKRWPEKIEKSFDDDEPVFQLHKLPSVLEMIKDR